MKLTVEVCCPDRNGHRSHIWWTGDGTLEGETEWICRGLETCYFCGVGHGRYPEETTYQYQCLECRNNDSLTEIRSFLAEAKKRVIVIDDADLPALRTAVYSAAAVFGAIPDAVAYHAMRKLFDQLKEMG